ncbi:hypothetical protein DVR12_07935 [Chitinophaga silvatica]|uniref:Uncharacterized protein n=1 Tax=Chitinophaga silvatica TaxID=2282649 RepID=A0A3E1YF22_9BACT|nr:hypothetical protein [Chitinophaga silvatica]RFS25104.1 hypothetical protein DVR12_07935 [Chitinophaga silvatica]
MKLLFKYLITISIATHPGNLFGQSDSLSMFDFIYNKLYKNIAAYNIRFANIQLNGRDTKDLVEDGFEYYNAFLPDNGYKLAMEISESNLIYPNKEYKVYKVYVNNFKYVDSAHHAVRKLFDVWTRKDFLVAVSQNNNRYSIKYLSGQFFPSKIISDFNTTLNNPTSYIDYLNYRMYEYQMNNISFDRKVGANLYFNGYSDVLGNKVTILLEENNIESPKILQ